MTLILYLYRYFERHSVFLNTCNTEIRIFLEVSINTNIVSYSISCGKFDFFYYLVFELDVTD